MSKRKGADPSKTRAGENLPKVEIVSRANLRSWLKENHKSASSVWGVIWKKKLGAPHVPYADIVEELICFGWIDSLPRSLDDTKSMLLLSPRKASSNWSKINKDRAERMIALGKMTKAGLDKIAQAKSNGTWFFLNDVDALAEPPDLNGALQAAPPARDNWDRFPPSTRRGILEWIKNAKTPGTRARRIETTATLAKDNLRANQYRQILPGSEPKRDQRTHKSGRKSGI